MKRFIITALAAVVALSLNAQSTDKKSVKKEGPWIEVNGGVSISSLSRMENHTGWHMAAMFETAANNKGVYVNTGIAYRFRGASVVEYSQREDINYHAMELLVNIGYRYRFNKKIAIFGEMGPYIAYCFGGKTHVRRGDWYDKEYDTFSDDAPLNHFDAGMGIKVGAELFGRIPISAGYMFGFRDMGSNFDNERNFTCLTVSIVYRFKL